MQKGFTLLLLLTTFIAHADNETYIKCTETSCPTLPKIEASDTVNDAIIFETTKENKVEFMKKYFKQFINKNTYKNNRANLYYLSLHTIEIHPESFIDSQPIIGFGGAFTDTAAMLYQKMPPKLRAHLIESYFSELGSSYTLGRVPIASTDFSCRQYDPKQKKSIPTLSNCSKTLSLYSYADKTPYDLTQFALQTEDIDYKIPMIKAAMSFSPNLKLFASAWSAPAWMKTNGNMIGGQLKQSEQGNYAAYLIKFLEAYKALQINFWGLTVQNEPADKGIISKFINWQSMYFSKEEEALFIKNALGPALKGYEKKHQQTINLMIHDDQITTIHERTSILNDPDVAQYVNGAALHWYLNTGIFYKKLDYAYLNLNHTANSNRFILATEACTGYIPINKGPQLGDWSRGVSYAKDIIKDLNHHVSGWTDWNLVLDMNGGPTWVENFVDAPILFDAKHSAFYKQPMYFYLAHFSKFIRPGSKVLSTISNGAEPLHAVSFHVAAHDNMADQIVLVVLNDSIFGKRYLVSIDSSKGKRDLAMYIAPLSIQTIVLPSRDRKGASQMQ